jgi:tetratricopeptide (TPR) repeat protein
MWRAGFSWSGHEKDVALLNTGVHEGVVRYADISAVSGFHSVGDGRAIALTDWDGDGDMDVWMMSRTAPQLQFFENTTRSRSLAESTESASFLMVRLEGDGKQVPRDATGARVELVLEPSQPRLVRTVRTGDTHCSHSTHWLHFGLGEQPPRVQELVVRWPDGVTERFPPPALNGHYVVRRGGKVQRFKVQQLTPTTANPQEPLANRPIEPPSRLSVYSNRLPSLLMDWETAEQKTRRMRDLRGKPVVMILWASWCSNCLEELSTLSKRNELLPSANVTLVAMNIDGVADSSDGAGKDLESIVRLWKRLKVPGELGVGSQELMHRLEAFRAATHWIGGPLRIPALFVFDEEGRLVAHAEGVLDDRDWKRLAIALKAEPKQWMEMAMPFPGRRYGGVAPIRPADVPQRLMEDHEFALAQSYLDTYGATLKENFRKGKDPGLPRVLYTLGVHQGRAGQAAEAISLYREAIDLRPSYAEARYNLAGLLQAAGEKNAALEQYTALLEFAPSHAAAWHNRGLLRQEAQDLTGAVTDYQAALRHAAGSLDTLNNLGNTLTGLQRWNEAFEVFEEAIKIGPGVALTHYNYAVSLEQAARLPQAEKAYQRAIELDPANAQYAHNLGVLMAKQARWAEAKQWLQQALKLQPDHPTAARNLQKVLAIEQKASRP